MAPIFAYLDDVSGESTVGNARIFTPIFFVSPLVVAYGYTIERTAIGFKNLLFSLYDWWHYDSWVGVQMSDESIDGTNNLSTTYSASEQDIIISPIV